MGEALKTLNNKVETPLKGVELESALAQLSERRGLAPDVVGRFLATDLEQAETLSTADKWIPAGLLAAYVVSRAVNNVMGDAVPTMGTLSPVIHELLQSVHNLSVNAAKSPAIRDHVPYVLLELSAGFGALKTLPQWFTLRGKREKAREQQKIVRQKSERGEMKFEMAKGHTAAFVGRGDWLADRLQETKASDQVMQYASMKIGSRVWQMIQQQGRQEDIFEVLDRGDFRSAGEALILPIKEEDMFLPGEDGHDMSLDEIQNLIEILDSYCKSRGIDQKKVLIVGRKTLRETYVQRKGASSKAIEVDSQTLAERVEEMSRKQRDIEIIDPTEIVMRKIAALANGRKIVFTGAAASDDRYGERFFQTLKEIIGEEPKSKREKVRVLYNITDIPTEVHVGQRDIAVILDSSKKETLLKRGIPEENIIVVPDEILKILDRKVDEK